MTYFLLILLMQSSKDTWYEFYNAGRKAYLNKDYKQTILNLEAATEIRPDSNARAKPYGVHFIEYYPYYMLAESYYFTGQRDLAKASLDKAFNYGEAQDQRIAPLLDLLKSLILKANTSTSVASALPNRMGDFLELLAAGRYEEAQTKLPEFFPGESNANIQSTLGNIVKQLIQNRSELTLLQKTYATTISDLLTRAKRYEKSGNLSEALSHYLTILSIQPQHAEALQANKRLRDQLSSQGKTEAEIEKILSNTSQLLSEREKEIVAISKRNKDLEAVNQNLIASLNVQQTGDVQAVPQVQVAWQFIPNSNREHHATFFARVTANIPLMMLELKLNGHIIGNWQANKQQDFTIPAFNNYKFEDQSNTLLLHITDAAGNIHEELYPYTFSPIPQTLQFKPWLIKILPLIAVTYALIYFVFRLRKARAAFLNRFNPYIAGAPILNETMFFGRKNLLRQILNTLHNNSLMVYGERRIGKTSFLHQLLHILPEVEDPEYQFVPVFIDLQGVKEEHFFTLLDHEIETVLEGLGHNRLEPVQGELKGRGFIHRIRLYIQFLKNAVPKNPKLVLLLDEVDVMNGFSEETNQQLRSVFMKGFAKHLVAVMAGIHINTTWKSEGSPWYNFFEQLELKPFDQIQAKKLVTDPVRGVYKYQPEAVTHILELTHGKPYLIQKICVNLVSLVLNEHRRTISKQDVERVFKEIKTELWAAELPQSAIPSPPVAG